MRLLLIPAIGFFMSGCTPELTGVRLNDTKIGLINGDMNEEVGKDISCRGLTHDEVRKQWHNNIQNSTVIGIMYSKKF